MLNQLLNLTKLTLIQSRQQLRHSSVWSCSHLSNRSVLRVSGDDRVAFLQGLVTNDIESLSFDQQRSLYCMFLNTQGRILFDALIYQGQEQTDFLLDVDKNVAALAKKHMSVYKIRKKVRIDPMENLAVFATFKDDTPVNPPSLSTQSPVLGSTFCSGGAQTPGLGEENMESFSRHCKVFPDPRLAALGSRVILDTNQCKNIDAHLPDDVALRSQDEYVQHRCILGVTEGADEVGVAKSTPLEFNLDYLHGVSFHKGCYLGQELTARTHHTGVIRKRIVPLLFNKQEENCDSTADINVLNEKGKNVGKIKKISGKVGLGLMRLKETFDAEKLTVGDSDTEILVSKPAWWPVEKNENNSEA